MRNQIAIHFLLFLCPALTLAEPQSCAQSRSPWWARYDNKECYCGAQLSNVTVTLPPGLRLKAVCGLSFDGRPLDLNREKVSLDAYTEGNYPDGFVYISGTAKTLLTGTVTVEEGPAGELWFDAVAEQGRPVFWKH